MVRVKRLRAIGLQVDIADFSTAGVYQIVSAPSSCSTAEACRMAVRRVL